jgi:hypothetical protein
MPLGARGGAVGGAIAGAAGSGTGLAGAGARGGARGAARGFKRTKKKQLQMWQEQALLRTRAATHQAAKQSLGRQIKDLKDALASRSATLEELDEAFKREVRSIGIPVNGEPRIDTKTYLPTVGAVSFEALQASGGGASTALNIAYHLALLTYDINNLNVLMPRLLIIDSPRKAIGNSDADRELGRRIYERISTVTKTFGSKIQIILADNDVPEDIITTPQIRLTAQRSTVPGVINAGVGQAVRVEDLVVAER